MKKYSFINLPDVEVEITSIEELFTYEQIYLVYSFIEMHECHGNAFHIALFLKCEPPIEIVEGYLEDSNGTRIPHAFNKIGDKYFDFTLEKFLPSFENLKANKYIAKRIYTKDEMFSVIAAMNSTCISFDGVYKKKYKYTINDEGILIKDPIKKTSI